MVNYSFLFYNFKRGTSNSSILSKQMSFRYFLCSKMGTSVRYFLKRKKSLHHLFLSFYVLQEFWTRFKCSFFITSFQGQIFSAGWYGRRYFLFPCSNRCIDMLKLFQKFAMSDAKKYLQLKQDVFRLIIRYLTLRCSRSTLDIRIF